MGNKQTASAGELAEKHHITVEEVEALTAAFKAGNKKGGAVKLKKFKKIMEEVHKLHPNDSFSPQTAEIIFEVLDQDKNGKVDGDEFLSGVTVLSSGSIEDKAKMVFRAIDKNKSGKVTKSEFRSYVTKTMAVSKAIFNNKTKEDGLPLVARLGLKAAMKFGEGEVIDEVVKEVFLADKDGDGEVSLEEWVAAAKSGNEMIESFLNPGEQIQDGVKHIGEALSESGLVTTKEEYNDFKKEMLN